MEEEFFKNAAALKKEIKNILWTLFTMLAFFILGYIFGIEDMVNQFRKDKTHFEETWTIKEKK